MARNWYYTDHLLGLLAVVVGLPKTVQLSNADLKGSASENKSPAADNETGCTDDMLDVWKDDNLERSTAAFDLVGCAAVVTGSETERSHIARPDEGRLDDVFVGVNNWVGRVAKDDMMSDGAETVAAIGNKSEKAGKDDPVRSSNKEMALFDELAVPPTVTC